MNLASGKLFSAPKNFWKAIIAIQGTKQSFIKKQLHLKQIVLHSVCIFVLLSVPVLKLQAQEIKKNAAGANNSSEVVLRIKGLADEKFSANVENILNEYRGKILSHVIDKKNNAVSVVISDKIQVTDVLEVFEMHGIHAGYMNEKNEYISLDEDGELAEPINISK